MEHIGYNLDRSIVLQTRLTGLCFFLKIQKPILGVQAEVWVVQIVWMRNGSRCYSRRLNISENIIWHLEKYFSKEQVSQATPWPILFLQPSSQAFPFSLIAYLNCLHHLQSFSCHSINIGSSYSPHVLTPYFLDKTEFVRFFLLYHSFQSRWDLKFWNAGIAKLSQHPH